MNEIDRKGSKLNNIESPGATGGSEQSNLQETQQNLERILGDKNLDPVTADAIRKQLQDIKATKVSASPGTTTIETSENKPQANHADAKALLLTLQEAQIHKSGSSTEADELTRSLGM